MLGLLTLNWPLLDRWHQSPAAFTDADFTKLRNSGINVFHPAVAFEQGSGYDVTRAWFANWNRFIEWHPDYFVRVNDANDPRRARHAERHVTASVCRTQIICAAWTMWTSSIGWVSD